VNEGALAHWGLSRQKNNKKTLTLHSAADVAVSKITNNCYNRGTVQSTQSRRLNFRTFSLLLSTTFFGRSFDHYQVEKSKYKTKNATAEACPSQSA